MKKTRQLAAIKTFNKARKRFGDRQVSGFIGACVQCTLAVNMYTVPGPVASCLCKSSQSIQHKSSKYLRTLTTALKIEAKLANFLHTYLKWTVE